MSSSILVVSNLTTSFRIERLWKPVVRKVSFDIKPKDTLAVVGESGSGNSVTALSIMRLNPAPVEQDRGIDQAQRQGAPDPAGLREAPHPR